jgi:voltage-gated potassium channel
MTFEGLRDQFRSLYFGHRGRSRVFRIAILLFDLVTILYFLATIREEHVGIYRVIDLAIFGIFLAELFLRLTISHYPRKFFKRLSTWADIAVLVSLIVPLLMPDLGFLSILRTLRFVRSYRIMLELKQYLPIPKRYDDVANAAGNLVVFVFILSSMVWVLEANTNPDIGSWLDAVYFTISTLTTTGFGDITMQDPAGKILSIVIMVFGVALFVRLAQALFRPYKVYHVCPSCALTRHDPDAVHCKHCGIVLDIENEGDW